MLADAAWTQPLDIARANEGIVRFVAGPGGHAGWIEGRRTFARVSAPGKVRRTKLKRAWRTAGVDARGRALTVTTVTSRRPCSGKRSYRLYVEVRRDGAPVQRLGDGCRNVGAPVLAVNARGQAVLAWLEIVSGANKRVVVATGSTKSGLRPRWNSGEGDAAGHAVAINPDGAAAVAYRRGSRMLVRRRGHQGFEREQDLGATPQRQTPGTAVAIDEHGLVTVAWTDACACGEAGMTTAPNQLRAARNDDLGRFGEAEVLDTGENVVRLPQAAAGAGVSLIAWRTENGPDATHVAISPPHTGYATRETLDRVAGQAVVHNGVPTLVDVSQAWRRLNGKWSPEPVGAGQSIPRALVTDPDGRLALFSQDGRRLRVSYRKP